MISVTVTGMLGSDRLVRVVLLLLLLLLFCPEGLSIIVADLSTVCDVVKIPTKTQEHNHEGQET